VQVSKLSVLVVKLNRLFTQLKEIVYPEKNIFEQFTQPNTVLNVQLNLLFKISINQREFHVGPGWFMLV